LKSFLNTVHGRGSITYFENILPLIQHFNFQLMHTTLKNVELLKHDSTATT